MWRTATDRPLRLLADRARRRSATQSRWTDNTDLVGAFDGYGNYYELILPYQFFYKSDESHDHTVGTSQEPNPGCQPRMQLNSPSESATGNPTFIGDYFGSTVASSTRSRWTTPPQ